MAKAQPCRFHSGSISSPHACTCTITYRTTLGGSATEDDRRELAELKDEEAEWSEMRPNRVGQPTGALQAFLGSGNNAFLQDRGSLSIPHGELVPIAASLSIGDLTVERGLLPGDSFSACAPRPERLDASEPLVASSLLEALKADSRYRWRNANRMASRLRLYRQSARAMNCISRTCVSLCALASRNLACWNTPRMPVLDLSAKVFVALILLQAGAGLWFSTTLIASGVRGYVDFNAACHSNRSWATADGVGSACIIEHVHITFHGCAVLFSLFFIVRSALQAIIFENPFGPPCPTMTSLPPCARVAPLRACCARAQGCLPPIARVKPVDLLTTIVQLSLCTGAAVQSSSTRSESHC